MGICDWRMPLKVKTMSLYSICKYLFLVLAYAAGAYFSYHDGNQDKPGEYLVSGLISAGIAYLLWAAVVRRLLFGYLLSRAPKEERNRFLKQWAVWRGSRILFGGLWRLYQIGLVLGGAMLFYWAFGIHTDKDGGDYTGWWMLGALAFAFFFCWGVTILTRRALDRFYATFRDDPVQQSRDGLVGDASPAEGLQRLGVGEKPDDCITPSSGDRKHLR